MPPTTQTTKPEPLTKETERAAQEPRDEQASVPVSQQPLAKKTEKGDEPKVPLRLGFAPSSVEEGWRMASIMAKSELVPKNYRNHPEDVLVAIELGIEVGLAPMQALQSIAVINGRPTLWGDGFLALIMASSHYQDHDEYYLVAGERRDGLVAEDWKKDDTAAVCTFVRRGKPTPITRKFTVAQARKAQLLTKEGTWQTYPDRQLQMRARGFAGRDAFPDVLRGIRPAEEVMDIPVDEQPYTVEVPAKEVRRISETPARPTEPAGTQEVTLGPASVSEVRQFMGGFSVVLAGGSQFDCEQMPDALELEKFKGTSHKLRVVCIRENGTLKLKSFAIAD